MIMWGKQDVIEIVKVIKFSLEVIVGGVIWEDVFGIIIEFCGNYKDYSFYFV